MSSHKNKAQHDKAYREKHKEQLQQLKKQQYEANRETKIAYQKDYYQRNKEKVSVRMRERHLKLSYNLTSQQYLDKVVLQNNCCAICNKPEHRVMKTGDVKPLSVDHNHITGEVRELLCNDCNALLGFAKEDIYVLQNSIKYLQKHSK